MNGQQLNVVMQELQSIKGLLIQMKETPMVKPDDELWTVDQVANYLHKKKGTIQSHYQGKPGFPRSKKIGNSQYWSPREIISYAKRGKAY